MIQIRVTETRVNLIGRMKKGTDQVPFSVVRITGLEPARRKTPEPKSGASANSAISAYVYLNM